MSFNKNVPIVLCKKRNMFTNNRVFLLVIIFILSVSCKGQQAQQQHSSLLRVKSNLKSIVNTSRSRTYTNTDILDSVADFINRELSKVCDTVFYQTYSVNGRNYKNVVGSLNTCKEKRLIIGAHYDVAGNQPGADDNASGVSGLLELAHLLSKENLGTRIDFVAYTLEEPPFFGTENMGSYIHAKSLYDSGTDVLGMICLEMIGYFNDTINSQTYPIKGLKLLYGKKGNFITVAQKFNNGKFGRHFKRYIKRQKAIRTISFKAPMKLTGIDFSDHRNYWNFGYSALMVTNTAFYRNHNYHKPTDSIETLDLNRMCYVIDAVFYSIISIQQNHRKKMK